MKKKLLAAMTLLAATWSMSSAATSYSMVCNGCSDTQTRAMVQGTKVGDYFVHDMLNRRLTHYSVTGKDVDTRIITNIAIQPAQQDQFNWVLEFYDHAGTLNYTYNSDASGAVTQASVNTLHTSTTLLTSLVAAGSAPGSPESAYDLINTPINQNAAISAVTTGHFWGQAPEAAVAWLSTFASHFTPVQVLYPVPVIITQVLTFGDGSTANIHWDVNTDTWEYTIGSAKDGTGNPIPENPDQAVGGTIGRQTYIWPNTNRGIGDAVRASQNLSNIGLPVGVPVFTSGGTWTVACVRTGGVTGTITCTTIHG